MNFNGCYRLPLLFALPLTSQDDATAAVNATVDTIIDATVDATIDATADSAVNATVGLAGLLNEKRTLTC
jgi:hypothetical protein